MTGQVSRICLKSGSLVANIGFSAMVVLVTSGAVLRYGFGWTPGWLDSVCAYLVLLSVVMSAGATLAADKHIRIKFFYDKLPFAAQNFLDLFCGVISLAIIGFLIHTTRELAKMSQDLGSTTPDGLSLYPMQILIPVGLVILFVAVLGFTVKAAARMAGGRKSKP